MSSLLDVIGWVGSICFAVCAVPQAWQSWRQGHGEGLSWFFLGLWLAGELLVTIYIIPKQDWPLLFNYAVNMLCLAVIFKYKLRPRAK